MRKGWLEKATVRKNPLNVLANQVLAMALSKTGPEKREEEIYATVKRAYPFKDLPEELFYKVVEYLRSIKTLWRDEGTVSHGQRTRTYFYENISMIPDEKKYKVVDITTRKPVASLDESYVASLEPYSKFIVKGRSWLLIEVEEDELLVQPSDDLGTLPSWVGEDIPVPLEVAMSVGRLRRERSQPLPDVVREYLDRQAKESLMPTDRLVTIERTLNYLVVNACFGSKVNETLGRYLSAMLATKHGTVVGLTTDPYRIMLEMPRTPRAEDIRLLLLGLDPSNLEAMMPLILKNSSYVRWEIVSVGKKFGAIRKDLDLHMLNFERLMDSLKDTVVFQEALSKVIWEDMDLENTKRVLKALRGGSIKMVEAKLSPIGRAGLESRRELLFPKKADRTILLAMKRRLAESDFRLACLSCGASRRARVESLPERIICNRCDGLMMAVVRMSDEGSLELIRKRDRLPKGMAKDFQRLKTNADLVRQYGKKAVMALLARGVGPTNAGRILARQHGVVSEDWEMDLLRDILEAEVNYARTKKFWD